MHVWYKVCYEFSAEINQNELICAIFGSGFTWNLIDWTLMDLDLDPKPDPDPVSMKLTKVKNFVTTLPIVLKRNRSTLVFGYLSFQKCFYTNIGTIRTYSTTY
jgi:hypothetical protein